MKVVFAAFIVGFFSAAAFAQSIELPRLTWPTEPATPETQDCTDPTQVDENVDCEGQ